MDLYKVELHLMARRMHPWCTEDCPHYLDLCGSGFQVKTPESGFQVETPESFAAKKAAQKKPTAGKARQIIKTESKILCILDPSRRAALLKDTAYDVSWITTDKLPPEMVKEVLRCRELNGYVFPVPGKKNTVRIYDWVSAVIGPSCGCSVAHVCEQRHT